MTLLSSKQNLNNCLDNYKIFFEGFRRFKQEVMDNPTRKAKLKKLIDEMDGWDMVRITAIYNEHKTIYDYLA